MSAKSRTNPDSDPALASRRLVGDDNLVDQVRRAHALLSLVSILDISVLPKPMKDGFHLIIQQALGVLEKAGHYLALEQRVVELSRNSTEAKP